MTWVEVRFQATHEAVDWVRTLLGNAHYTGDVLVQPNEVESEPKSEQRFPLTMRLYFPNQGAINHQLNQLETQLSSLLRTGQISDWESAIATENPTTNPTANPTAPLIHRIGDRIVILPATIDQLADQLTELSSFDIAIKLPETLAFGSGLHPATQLSLRLIERYVMPNIKVLDLGCGSGILSVAIARLGGSVLAVDNDAIAVRATEVAVALNEMAGVTVQRGSLGRGSEMGHWMGGDGIEADGIEAVEAIALENGVDLGFDLIVANILGRMHLSLIHDYRNALLMRLQQVKQQQIKPLAMVIVAGFTVDYEPELDAAFAEAGFCRVDCERLAEWVAIAYQHSTLQIHDV